MSDDVPLYERDPDAWRALLADGNRTQPRKRVGADVIIRDQHGRILIVDPSYKPDWDLPGGMADANEPPHLAARRELLEELGLIVMVGRLLVIDWISPHGPWDDSLMFVFDGGVLDTEQVQSIVLRDGEISAYEFLPPDQAQPRLRPYMWLRIRAAFDALTHHTTAYLHDGVPI